MLNTKIIISIQILLLVFFIFIWYKITWGKLPIDEVINSYFQNNYTDSWKQFFMIIADIWDTFWVMILAFFFSIYFYYKKYFSKLKVLLVPMILWVGTSTFVKFLVARERPENMIIEYWWYSFPSGHSVFAVLFYWLLVYLFWDIIKNKALKYSALVLAVIMWILVMISRLYLSVHYASDVFAGAILGLFFLLFWVVLNRRFKK